MAVDDGLPDVRDGLTPVRRGILAAMARRGFTHDRERAGSDAVIDDITGGYGYYKRVFAELTAMVTDPVARYPLIAGAGTFDNDARPEDTEVWLTAIGAEVAGAGSHRVLSAPVPALLLNGTLNAASAIPPHNLAELGDVLLARLDMSDGPLEALLEHLPGPDFPDGGEVIATAGMDAVYATGRGEITIRPGVTNADDDAELLPPTTFDVRMQALVGEAGRTLGLLEILDEYLVHRRAVVGARSGLTDPAAIDDELRDELHEFVTRHGDGRRTTVSR